MSFGPGRKANVQEEVLKSCIIKRKNEIFLENGKLKSKKDDIWKELSKDLGEKLTPETIYNKLCNHKFKERIGLTSASILNGSDDSEIVRDESLETSTTSDGNKNLMEFTMFSNKVEFEELIETKEYKRKETGRRNQYTRVCLRLSAGKWQHWISEEIWKATKLPCGFNFYKHYLYSDGSGGRIEGYCTCGSILKCIIDSKTLIKEVQIDCSLKKGDQSKKCRKRFLRAPIRQEIAEELKHKGAELFRTEQAAKRMMPGDPEPPTLPTAPVLRTARAEQIKLSHLHKDPRIAIEIMKHTIWANAIHGIGLSPFFAHFWTNHMLHLYLNYSKKSEAVISLDSTGKLAKKIDLYDGRKSKRIYLYLIVVNDNAGQYIVAMMISEAHDTITIKHFLDKWVQQGSPVPKEFVSDGESAIQIAAIRSFTRFKTIRDYCAACAENELPECYIRQDVAHFIKLYVNYLALKTNLKRIRVFFKASIGQLILSRDLETATKILKAIFIVAYCESDGRLLGMNEISQCSQQRDFLKSLIDPNDFNVEEPENDTEEWKTNQEEYKSIFDYNPEDWTDDDYWSKWAQVVDTEALKISKEEIGEHDNAYYLPDLVKKLKQDIKLFPLWSCICRDRFGYGSIPASSAPVESQIKNIKQDIFKNNNKSKPKRVDEIVDNLLNYVVGRGNIMEAKIMELEKNNNYSNNNDFSSEMHNSLSFIKDAETVKEENEVTVNNNVLAEITNNESHLNLSESSEELYSKKKQIMCELCKEIFNENDLMVKNDKFLCEKCIKMRSTEEILESRKEENWMGLSKKDQLPSVIKRTKTGKKSLYLDKNKKTFDALSHEKLKGIPIIKNGNHQDIQSVIIDKIKHDFSNTCAMDSILEVFIVAALDNTKVENLLRAVQKINKTISLIMYIKKYGVAHAYQKRGVILKDLVYSLDKRKISSHGSAIFVECSINAFYLCQKLFENMPQSQVCRKCSQCDTIKKYNKNSFLLKNCLLENALAEGSLFNFFEPDANCSKCQGTVTSKYESSGTFVFMEMEKEEEKVNIDKIPTSFPDFVGNKEDEYILLGIIRFINAAFDLKGNAEKNKENIKNVMGHYTAICKRQNSWVEFDDINGTQRNLKSKAAKSIYVALLIYAKIPKK